MKISDLIKVLSRVKSLHGDLEAKEFDNRESQWAPIEVVEVIEDEYHEPLVRIVADIYRERGIIFRKGE